METTRKPDTRILIAVPCYRYCEPETMKSIYNLEIPEGAEVTLEFVTGYTVAQARNRCVRLSLDGGFDYTFFVDGDVILPKGILPALLATKAPIATGWYIKKLQDGEKITELYAPTEDGKVSMANIRQESIPETPTVIRLTGCGFGCTLVSNEVFRAMGEDSWFQFMDWHRGSICTEDLNFCVKALNLHYHILCDTAMRCGHKGTYIY